MRSKFPSIGGELTATAASQSTIRATEDGRPYNAIRNTGEQDAAPKRQSATGTGKFPVPYGAKIKAGARAIIRAAQSILRSGEQRQDAV
jgi:hypothetical protein